MIKTDTNLSKVEDGPAAELSGNRLHAQRLLCSVESIANAARIRAMGAGRSLPPTHNDTLEKLALAS